MFITRDRKSRSAWSKTKWITLFMTAALLLSACTFKSEKPDPEFLSSAMLVRAGIDDVGMTVGEYVNRIDGAIKPDGKPVVIKGWSRDGNIYTLHATFSEDVELEFQWAKTEKWALMLPVELSGGTIEALQWLMLSASLKPANVVAKVDVGTSKAAKVEDISMNSARIPAELPEDKAAAASSDKSAQDSQNATSEAVVDLGSYVGKPFTEFVADAAVQAKLTRLLGNELPVFLKYMSESGNVALNSGFIWVVGNNNRQVIGEEAALAINTNNGNTVVVFLDASKKFKYFGVGRGVELPAALSQWYEQRRLHENFSR